MKLKLISFLTLAVITLSGCIGYSNTEFENIKVNKHFVLKQEINISPYTTRTFIQNGKAMNKSGFNRYAQHCRIEVKELLDTKQTISPDRFVITSIEYGEEMIASNKPIAQFVMATSGQTQNDIKLAGGFDQPRIETMDLIHLNLVSAKQPNVMRLTCAGALSDGNIPDGPEIVRPGLKEINLILGNIGYIEK